MINKINISSVNKKNTPQQGLSNNQTQPAFKGGVDSVVNGFIWGVQKCEQHPMVNVSVLDLSTAIIPRTIVETYAGSKKVDENGNPVKDENGKTQRHLNFFGGFEAFRREASGLVINCILPSFLVMGAGTLFNRPIMGKFDKNLINNWANSEAYDKIAKFYKPGEATLDSHKDFFKRAILSMEGVDGEAYNGGLKRFADLLAENPDEIKNLQNIDEVIAKIKLKPNASDALDKLANAAFNGDYKLTNKAYKQLVDITHISETIRFVGEKDYLGNNLSQFCKDTPKVLYGAKTQGIKTTEELSKYFAKAKKLVNWKSIAGLGVIIPLAIAAQPINRWITYKLSGRKGAPIYNDFADRKEDKELSSKEKGALLRQKFISIASMVGVAGLSMLLDKPSFKSLYQFKGLFPTMDQARIISTATFASRMGAAEDKNELREATIRDIATFASFYFLGDYAAKGIATLMEKYSKSGVKLLNRLTNTEKDANAFKKFWNWAKNTSLKSSDELATAGDKRLRTIYQIGNLAFSLVSLGIFIPLYTRTQTNKKIAQENLAKQNATTDTISTNGAGTSAAQASLFKTAPAAVDTSFKAFINS